MYDNTITLFNRHNGKWYPSIIEGVDMVATEAASPTTLSGITNGDAVEIIIHCTKAKGITTTAGLKAYVSPKAYAACSAPADCITFTPETDFIYEGAWPSTSPIDDVGYESGLYAAMNEEYDGVHMITSAVFFGLLPHFEIGGR